MVAGGSGNLLSMWLSVGACVDAVSTQMTISVPTTGQYGPAAPTTYHVGVLGRLGALSSPVGDQPCLVGDVVGGDPVYAATNVSRHYRHQLAFLCGARKSRDTLEPLLTAHRPGRPIPAHGRLKNVGSIPPTAQKIPKFG